MGEMLAIAAMLLLLGGGDDEPDPRRPGPRPRPRPDGPRPDLPDVDDEDPVEPDPFIHPQIGVLDPPVGPGGEEPPKPGEDLPSVLDDYPMTGRLYQVREGDTGALSANNGGIAHRAIASKAYTVAIAKGLSKNEALSFASAMAQKHRTKYWLAIEGNAWNDHLYGTYGYGQQAMANPTTKRAIRLLPQHADNALRIGAHEAPIRSIILSTPNNAKQGTGLAAPGAPSGNFELLNLPAIDGDALYDSHALVLVPWLPQWIRDLGVLDRSGAPASTKWGA